MTTVAALYVETNGCYFGLPDVDPWDEARDAWLYVVGERPPELDWSRPKGTHQIGFHDQRGPDRNKPTLGRKEASATPLPFRDLLLSIARTANSQRKVA